MVNERRQQGTLECWLETAAWVSDGILVGPLSLTQGDKIRDTKSRIETSTP